ncbi:MAG: CAP domain-containing protein [Rothia sp. (in: high G+C Gram-positive bacteria)]|nr:CAP domain-containing protein [Rothia sp. (in: high G+C Gram-positive bacteria)]
MTSKNVNRRLFFTTTLVGATALTFASAQAASSDLRWVSDTQRAQDSQNLLNMINNYRVQNGLSRLLYSPTLSVVERGESERQFTEGYYSHSSVFLNDSRVTGYANAREIIALSYNDDLNELMNFWKSSPHHNEALLLSPANAIGIGFAYGKGSSGGGILPWRILATVSIYQYSAGRGPQDLRATVVTTPTYQIKGGIAERYYADGGAATYGNPVMNEQGGLVEGGVFQKFILNNMSYKIMWHPVYGAYAVLESGAIGGEWMRNGYERGYGYPVMNEARGLIEGGHIKNLRTAIRTTKLCGIPFTELTQ